MSAMCRASRVSPLRLARSRTLVFTFQMDTVLHLIDEITSIMEKPQGLMTDRNMLLSCFREKTLMVKAGIQIPMMTLR